MKRTRLPYFRLSSYTWFAPHLKMSVYVESKATKMDLRDAFSADAIHPSPLGRYVCHWFPHWWRWFLKKTSLESIILFGDFDIWIGMSWILSYTPEADCFFSLMSLNIFCCSEIMVDYLIKKFCKISSIDNDTCYSSKIQESKIMRQAQIMWLFRTLSNYCKKSYTV